MTIVFFKILPKSTQIRILDKTIVQFLFATSETQLNYCHQKVNVRVVSQVTERLQTQDLMKLENFKKISEILGCNNEYPPVHPKSTFLRFSVKNRKKSALKHSTENPILFSFVILSPNWFYISRFLVLHKTLHFGQVESANFIYYSRLLRLLSRTRKQRSLGPKFNDF